MRDLESLARERWRVTFCLTSAIVVCYFGFILLVAFAKESLAILLLPGLSLGIVLGASVIVAAWLLTYAYVRWANRRFDPESRRLGR
jgi:uncharacterized membrane protein (DUF485 family)